MHPGRRTLDAMTMHMSLQGTILPYGADWTHGWHLARSPCNVCSVTTMKVSRLCYVF